MPNSELNQGKQGIGHTNEGIAFLMLFEAEGALPMRFERGSAVKRSQVARRSGSRCGCLQGSDYEMVLTPVARPPKGSGDLGV